MKDSEPNTINRFAGFKYHEVITNDFTILQPMLNHIKEVICNNSQDKYDYFMCWFANIIQNITVKNGMMIIYMVLKAQVRASFWSCSVNCSLSTCQLMMTI